MINQGIVLFPGSRPRNSLFPIGSSRASLRPFRDHPEDHPLFGLTGHPGKRQGGSTSVESLGGGFQRFFDFFTPYQ